MPSSASSFFFLTCMWRSNIFCEWHSWYWLRTEHETTTLHVSGTLGQAEQTAVNTKGGNGMCWQAFFFLSSWKGEWSGKEQAPEPCSIWKQGCHPWPPAWLLSWSSPFHLLPSGHVLATVVSHFLLPQKRKPDVWAKWKARFTPKRSHSLTTEILDLWGICHDIIKGFYITQCDCTWCTVCSFSWFPVAVFTDSLGTSCSSENSWFAKLYLFFS